MPNIAYFGANPGNPGFPHMGHEATDTGLAYAPVSQVHDHHHTKFNVLPCCTAAQTRSVPNVALRSPLQVAIKSS